MLLTREEKETLKNYLTNLKGFAFENDLTEEQRAKIQREIMIVQDKIENTKAFPMFEVIDEEGNMIQRVANPYKLEELTGTKRGNITSRMNSIKYRTGSYVKTRGNDLFDGTVFSVRNHFTDSRTYVRILEN
jgi:hypothetical protein